MRKLQSAKNGACEHGKHTGHARQTHQPTKQLPKRTITSNWRTRNDSSNVCGVLHPDEHLETPRKLRSTKHERASKTKGVHKKCCLGSNNCYCRDRTMRPKLLTRPRKCLTVEEFERRVKEDDLSRTSLTDDYKPFRECICEEIDYPRHYNSTKCQFLNRGYQDEPASRCLCLDYMQQRKDYEAYREQQEAEEFREGEAYFGDETGEEAEGHNSVIALMGTKLEDSQKGSSFATEDHEQSIEDLKQFRNQHYFETHGTDQLGEDIPEHTCVHQFQLDGRLLPEAVNVDSYGRSRCAICNKPLEDGSALDGSNAKNFLKRYKLGLVPRRISVGGDNSKIELKLKEEDFDKFKGFIWKFKRPDYINSLALRQQRMTC